MTDPERQRSIEDRTDELLDRLPSITTEDALLMAQLWDEEDPEGRRRAWQRAKAAIERARLTEVLDRARDGVGFWIQAKRSDFQGIRGLLGQEGDQASMKRAAAPAVLDAVAALLAERELQSSDYDLLMRPWRSTVEHESDDDAPGAPGDDRTSGDPTTAPSE